MRDSQLTMARYLRDPAGNPPPEGVEERRLKVYEDLVYNNIEGFISGGFPVLRSLYADADWHGLVRLFIDQHRCRSPYFLEISQIDYVDQTTSNDEETIYNAFQFRASQTVKSEPGMPAIFFRYELSPIRIQYTMSL